MGRLTHPDWVEGTDFIRCRCGIRVGAASLRALLVPQPSGCIEFQGQRWEGYGRRCHELVHRLVWRLAYGDIPVELVLRHRCDNPPCANLDHLLLGSQAQNMQDARERSGFISPPQPGELNAQAKLTDGAVRDIRTAHAEGASITSLATSYGVARFTIHKVVYRKGWTHVA